MKRWSLLFLALAVTVPLLGQEDEGPATAQGKAVDTTGKGYTAAFVIEPVSGQVLLEENADVVLPTASMAKMMTLLIVLDEIKEGRLAWDSPVTVSPRASKMGGSQIYLRAGSVWPVKNLVIATMVHSANDAAQALAEKVAGSSEAFADLMNDRAKSLGLKNSTFYDPHGLPNPENPDQVDKMSARELAILGIELMKDPFMRKLAVVAEMPFKNGTLEKIYNPNHLVNPRKANYYDAATGIKTGYTGPAGYCITASAKRGDMELVCVVMGARAPKGPLSSFGIAAKMMNDAFLRYRLKKIVTKGTVVGQANVKDGAASTVPAIASGDAGALVKRGDDANIKVAFNATEVTAPVKRGQPVGTIVVQDGSKTIAKIPAIAGADVGKESWWKAFWPF